MEHNHLQILTVRAVSGLSGDMMLAGLLSLAELSETETDALANSLGLPALHGALRLERRFVNQIAGWGCNINLPHEHEHRTLTDILQIIEKSALEPRAKELSAATFTLLARAEAAVHGKSPEDVHFHEVGALDSILDICLNCALFVRLNPARFVCSPLPMGEGGIHCAHGWIPSPAPAVLELMQGVPVCGFAGQGETVTPTAMALLKALGADFGPWPSLIVEKRALVYGSKVFENAPNGAIWAMGRASGRCPMRHGCPGHEHGHEHSHGHGNSHEHGHGCGHHHHHSQEADATSLGKCSSS